MTVMNWPSFAKETTRNSQEVRVEAEVEDT